MKLNPIRSDRKIRPQLPFWSLLFITGFLLFTRWLFDEVFFLSALYFVAIYFSLAIVYSLLVLDNLDIDRKSRYHRRQVGDLYEENLMIANHSLLPIFWMQINDRSALSQYHARRVIGFLGGRQGRIIRINSYLQKRGNVALSPIEVITSDPIGCFSISKCIHTTGSLIILPYRVDLPTVTTKERLSDEGGSSRILPQKGDRISGSVREYSAGDPFNRIHWPTTARKGNLYTKLPDQTVQRTVWICLDCHKSIHTSRMERVEQQRYDYLDTAHLRQKYALPPDTMETAVSITTSLAVTWLKKGIDVGLVFNQQPLFTILPGHGSRQQKDILNSLTYVQADSKISLATMLESFSSRLKPGNICFLVTPDDSSEMVSAVQSLTRNGIDMRVIHIFLASFSSGYTGASYQRDWSFIRAIHFGYGDNLTDVAHIL
ncbi:MAG: DUF58 domain-containing protein [Leptolinea sp.]|nr:DUF58 domain-containing protein [Leptolinea sp.]